MGTFQSKSSAPFSGPKADMDALERQILETVRADGHERKEKETEALIIAGSLSSSSRPFCDWLLSIDKDKLTSVCMSAEYIHGAAAHCAGILDKEDIRAAVLASDRSLVFHVVLAAALVLKKEHLFECQIAEEIVCTSKPPLSSGRACVGEIYTPGSRSVGRGLVIFAAKPAVVKEILEERIRLESINSLF